MGINQQKGKSHKNVCERKKKRDQEIDVATSENNEWKLSKIDVTALRFIREESGHVYRDQVIRCVQKVFQGISEEDIVDSVKTCLDNAEAQKWIVVDDTDGIVTIPSKRKEIDWLIGYLKPWENSSAKEYSSLKLSWGNAPEGTGWGSFQLNTETMGISIKVKPGIRLKNFNLDEIYQVVYEKVEKNRKLSKRLGELHFEGIVAREVSYEGRTTFTVRGKNEHRTWFSGQFDFSRSRFEQEVVLQDVVYIANCASKEIGNAENEKINFRDCEFEKGVCIRNLSIVNSTTDTQITFEDSIVKGNMEVLYSEFGHAKLNCLQMIVGQHIYCPEPENKIKVTNPSGEEFVNTLGKEEPESELQIHLKNLFMYEDAVIDFSHVEISEHGKVQIENVPVLPRVFMNLQMHLSDSSVKGVCPKTVLTLHNCSLYGIMEIGNVSELETKEFINLGVIESAPERDWGMIVTEERFPSNDHLVQAVKNNVASRKKESKGGAERRRIVCEGARSFVILKKNYELCGMNDAEDEALIQYMLHHHRFYICTHNKVSKSKQETEDEKKRRFYKIKKGLTRAACKVCSLFHSALEMIRALLFRILHLTGGFGTSPLKTVLAMIGVAVFFGVVFFLRITFYGSSVEMAKPAWERVNIAVSNSLTSILPLPNTESYTERVIGTLLIGYFSIAIVRKTMR